MSTSNIHTAMLAVYNEVGYVQKTGQAPNYKFASEADFIEALRPAMIKHGIICTPHDITDINLTQGVSKSGTAVYYVVAKYIYRLTHAESGTYVDVCSLSGGLDTGGDKAPFKSNTGGQKYALRQSFLIETGIDPDDSKLTMPDDEKKPVRAAASTVKPAAVAKQPVAEVDEAAMIALKDKLIAEMNAMAEGDKAAYENFVNVQGPNLQAIKLFSKTNGAVLAELTAVVVKTKERVGAA